MNWPARLPLLLLMIGGWQPLATAQPLYPLVEIEDGDTLLIEIDGSRERIQLRGIDAPEDRDNPKLQADHKRTGVATDTLLELGHHATGHLRQLVAPGTSLRLVGDLSQRDRYGRMALRVEREDGASLGHLMVTDGYAVALRRHAPDPALKAKLLEHQQQAMDAQRGLWQPPLRAATLRWGGVSD